MSIDQFTKIADAANTRSADIKALESQLVAAHQEIEKLLTNPKYYMKRVKETKIKVNK